MTIKEYPGIVIAIEHQVARIEIVGTVTKPANVSRPQVVQVATERQDLYPGCQVVVLVETIPGNKAVRWSFVLPLMLFVGTLTALKYVTNNTGLAVLLAVFTLIPYYSIMWVIGSRSQGSVRYRLKND